MTVKPKNGVEAKAELQALGIGDLADMFGVTQRAIRFYEDQGLLTPKRVGKARVFDNRDRVRLDFILRGKRLGFTLAEIKEWLDLYDVEDGEQHQYQALLEKCRRRIAELERRRDDVNATLDELMTIETLALEKLGDESKEQRSAAATLHGEHHRLRKRAASGSKGRIA